MLNLLDLSKEEVEEYVINAGFPKYRAGQLLTWLYRGASFSEMTNLPEDFRRKLEEECCLPFMEIKAKLCSKIDETKKYLFDVGDGNIIESVLMKYKYGWTACISSQIGCRMGCKFCASSGMGFVRSLTSGQMLSQIISINRDNDIRIGHVVIMGIGEPFDNYDNVLDFLKKVSDEKGLGISGRHISLSTCGVVPGIEKLMKEHLGLTLSISLHAPNNEIRSRTMPINNTYPIEKLMEACRKYADETGRRITFEYAMISGVNDSAENARELIKLLNGMLCHVNLIPVNKITDGIYSRPDKKQIDAFAGILNDAGISATVRRELGRDINAACGQLRRNITEKIQKEQQEKGSEKEQLK